MSESWCWNCCLSEQQLPILYRLKSLKWCQNVLLVFLHFLVHFHSTWWKNELQIGPFCMVEDVLYTGAKPRSSESLYPACPAEAWWVRETGIWKNLLNRKRSAMAPRWDNGTQNWIVSSCIKSLSECTWFWNMNLKRVIRLKLRYD